MPPKQFRPVKAWTLQDLWRCPVVSDTKTLAEDLLNRASCELGAPWMGLVVPAHPTSHHRCSIGLKSGEFGGQFVTLNFLSCSSNHSWSTFSVWRKEATAIREYLCHEGVDMVFSNVYVAGMCQSYIHMNARTWGFPAESCSENLTAASGLPSFHSTSWCHLFPM